MYFKFKISAYTCTYPKRLTLCPIIIIYIYIYILTREHFVRSNTVNIATKIHLETNKKSDHQVIRETNVYARGYDNACHLFSYSRYFNKLFNYMCQQHTYIPCSINNSKWQSVSHIPSVSSEPENFEILSFSRLSRLPRNSQDSLTLSFNQLISFKFCFRYHKATTQLKNKGNSFGLFEARGKWSLINDYTQCMVESRIFFKYFQYQFSEVF